MIGKFVKYVVSLVLLFVTLFEAQCKSKEEDLYYCFLTNTSPVPVRDSLIIDAVTVDYFAWELDIDSDIYLVQLHYVDRRLEKLYYITFSKNLYRELTKDFIYLKSKNLNKNTRVDYFIGSNLSLEVWNFEKPATEFRYTLRK